MVDNINPTNQFHPYKAPDATPVKDRVPETGLGGILSRLGVDRSKFNTGSLNDQLAKARGMAQKNPSLVLGGLAALAIGAGLLRRRGMAR
jgi:LPXTG-motif cell wall-anchored protein